MDELWLIVDLTCVESTLADMIGKQGLNGIAVVGFHGLCSWTVAF